MPNSALFGTKNTGDFVPLAIKPGILSPVFTPNDGEYEWLLAKIAHNSVRILLSSSFYSILFQSADLILFQANLFMTQAMHFLRQHVIWGPVWVGMSRHLAPSHPIRAILAHPLTFVPAVASASMKVLFSPETAFDSTAALGAQGEFPILILMYADYNFSLSSFEGDLQLRGVEACVIAQFFSLEYN